MRAEFQALAALAMLTMAAAAPPGARFYGLAAGNASAFTLSPDGGAVSVLFDNFKIERTGDAPPPKHVAERRFTLAANPAAAGCRALFMLRGAAIAAYAPRVGAIAFSVGGRKMTLRPEEESWTLTARAALARGERTDVTITLDLPAPGGKGQTMLAIDSVDVSLSKCGGRK